MPIKPIHTKQEFYDLFPSKYEFVFAIYYSQEGETQRIRKSSFFERELTNILAYFNRLSNTDKYSHVLFVEINIDVVKQLWITVYSWPIACVYNNKQPSMIGGCQKVCNNRDEIRTALAPTLNLKLIE